jgi:hypothetical protein
MLAVGLGSTLGMIGHPEYHLRHDDTDCSNARKLIKVFNLGELRLGELRLGELRLGELSLVGVEFGWDDFKFGISNLKSQISDFKSQILLQNSPCRNQLADLKSR